MIKYENHCCGCATPGYPCLGDSCPYVNVPVYYCDLCDNNTYAEYEIDGEHYCEDCIASELKQMFNDLSITEKAEVLNVKLKRVGG